MRATPDKKAPSIKAIYLVSDELSSCSQHTRTRHSPGAEGGWGGGKEVTTRLLEEDGKAQAGENAALPSPAGRPEQRLGSQRSDCSQQFLAFPCLQCHHHQVPSSPVYRNITTRSPPHLETNSSCRSSTHAGFLLETDPSQLLPSSQAVVTIWVEPSSLES